MRVSGKTINITEKVLNNGTTTKLFTPVTSLMARRLVKVNSNSMETFMRDNSLTASSTERASTTSLSQARSTKVNSLRTTCTEKERWPGPMELTTKVISLTERPMEKVPEPIQTVTGSKANLRMTRRTVRPFFINTLRTDKCK
jgi:hypothetical protein